MKADFKRNYVYFAEILFILQYFFLRRRTISPFPNDQMIVGVRNDSYDAKFKLCKDGV